jgi:hypothetical protein
MKGEISRSLPALMTPGRPIAVRLLVGHSTGQREQEQGKEDGENDRPGNGSGDRRNTGAAKDAQGDRNKEKNQRPEFVHMYPSAVIKFGLRTFMVLTLSTVPSVPTD